MMPKIINDLINQFALLPGLSQRSSVKSVAHMLSHFNECIIPIHTMMTHIIQNIKKCPVCWNYSEHSPCDICSGSNKRDRGQICVVENVGALWSIERRKHYNGMYHVLGGVLSAIDGIMPDALNVPNLLKRITEYDGIDPMEVIIAIPPSVASGITIEYVVQAIREIEQKVVISKIAHGLPGGTKIEAIDDETIIAAFMSRIVVV